MVNRTVLKILTYIFIIYLIGGIIYTNKQNTDLIDSKDLILKQADSLKIINKELAIQKDSLAQTNEDLQRALEILEKVADKYPQWEEIQEIQGLR